MPSFNEAFYTILLSIIGTAIYSFLHPYIAKLLSSLSSTYRDRQRLKQEERFKVISEIASDNTLLILASMKGYFFDIAFLLMFITFLVMPAKSALYMAMAIFFGLLALIAAYRGAKQRKLVNEASALYKKSLISK